MSADNWANCPSCYAMEKAAAEAKCRRAEKAYGSVPVEEYLKLREAATEPIKARQTLREDYEVGIDLDGQFALSYRATCGECGFTFGRSFSEGTSPMISQNDTGCAEMFAGVRCGEERAARGGDLHCTGDCDDAFHDTVDGCHPYQAPAVSISAEELEKHYAAKFDPPTVSTGERCADPLCVASKHGAGEFHVNGALEFFGWTQAYPPPLNEPAPGDVAGERTEDQACGHPKALHVKSVESDYSFCELCEARSRLRDALTMERTYHAERDELAAKLERVEGQSKATIDGLTMCLEQEREGRASAERQYAAAFAKALGLKRYAEHADLCTDLCGCGLSALLAELGEVR